MPIGANSPGALRKINPDVPIPTINLFKTKRHRGWWAMRSYDKKTNKYICTVSICVTTSQFTNSMFVFIFLTGFDRSRIGNSS